MASNSVRARGSLRGRAAASRGPIAPRLAALALLALLMAHAPSWADAADGPSRRAVYDEDERTEIGQVARATLRESGAAVAAMFSVKQLKRDGAYWHLRNDPAYDKLDLCSSEPFHEQPNQVQCTAFLIDDDLVATAAHCLLAPGDRNGGALTCETALFVFDYALEHERAPTRFHESRVFTCAEIVPGENERPLARGTDVPHWQDWRVAALDRAPARRAPLAVYGGSGVPALETEVDVVGFPQGMPMKLSPGGRVHHHDPATGDFVIDADVSTSSSGSPVIAHARCGPVVIGVLSRGAPDVERRGECHVNLHHDPEQIRANPRIGQFVTSTYGISASARTTWYPGASCLVTPGTEAELELVEGGE